MKEGEEERGRENSAICRNSRDKFSEKLRTVMARMEKLASETSTSANFADDPDGVEPGALKLVPRKAGTTLQLPLIDSGGVSCPRTRNTRRGIVSRIQNCASHNTLGYGIRGRCSCKETDK